MGSIKIHAGDFLKGEGYFHPGVFQLQTQEHSFMGEMIPSTEIDSIEVANEESVKKLGGTIGWGAVGGLVLGPAGLLAGLLLGGKKKEVTFIVKFKDGRKFLGTTDNKTYIKIQATVFDK